MVYEVNLHRRECSQYHVITHTYSLRGLSTATSDSKALFTVVKLRAAWWRFGSSSRGIGLFLDERYTPSSSSSSSSLQRRTHAVHHVETPPLCWCRWAGGGRYKCCSTLSSNNSSFSKPRIEKKELVPCVPAFISFLQFSQPLFHNNTSKYKLAGKRKKKKGFSVSLVNGSKTFCACLT